MRTFFDPMVEQARVRMGQWGSPPCAPYGAFDLERDGVQIRVLMSTGDGWDHVSVSTPSRCPTWEEMHWIKGLFFRPEEAVMQLHPPEADYRNLHPYCLHMWRPQRQEIPLPPGILVAPDSSKVRA